MRRGIFGFDIWFYGIVALLLAVCQQPLVLGGLMLFVMLVHCRVCLKLSHSDF